MPADHPYPELQQAASGWPYQPAPDLLRGRTILVTGAGGSIGSELCRQVLRFEPAEITIRVGDKVVWRNTSDLVHTVTADPRITADASNVELPEGARPFNSAAIPAGQVFRHTFTVPGTYRYLCLPHAGQKMFGTVVVEPET